MTTFKKQLKDKDGNTIYPDVGLNLDDVVYSEDPNNTDLDNIIDPSSYSTEEKWTGGYWIDGKPIYKKTVVRNGSLPNGNTEISLGVLIDSLVDIDGSCTRASSGGIFFILPFVRPNPSTGSADQISWRIVTSNGVSAVRLEVGSGNFDFNDFKTVITVQYTKSS